MIRIISKDTPDKFPTKYASHTNKWEAVIYCNFISPIYATGTHPNLRMDYIVLPNFKQSKLQTNLSKKRD